MDLDITLPDYAAQLAVCIAGTARIYKLEELSAELAKRCPGAKRVIAMSVQRVTVQHSDWSTTLAYERFRAEALGTTTDSSMVCPA
jgi:hypothetical protein